MYKIPSSSKQFSQTNKNDKSGNIWYSKNMDFNEDGYIKLSPRMVQIISDNSSDLIYSNNFNLTPSLGRYNNSFLLATTEAPFKATISQTGLSVTQDVDTGVPTLDFRTRAGWWQNRWYVCTDNGLFYRTTSGSSWTNTGVSLTSGVAHPIEVFRSATYLALGNANTVLLLRASDHATQVTLTLPTDYQVIGIKFSGLRVGIVTKLSTTADGQNQEAYFFTWDGASGNASSGYPIGADELVGIAPYKGSWVILSKTGQVLYFNGGGFEEIARFPFFVKDRIWNSSTNGDIMIVDGDLIYFNVNNDLNTDWEKQETQMINNPAGVWCYDPAVGLYHKYSPSISQLNVISVENDTGIDIATDIFTISTGTLPPTGTIVKYTFSSNSPIGGLKGGQTYFIIKVSPTTFKLATTKQNAIDGQHINITSIGLAGSLSYFMPLTIKDYGQSFIITSGGMVTPDTKNIVYSGIFSSFRGYSSTVSSKNYLCMVMSGFDNMGYFVTPKMESEDIEDNYQKIYLKYLPLSSNDSITIKERHEDILGIPSVTPQRGSCTWVDNKTITVTADFSEIDTYLNTTDNECEVEILSGSGAGNISQISSISESGGVYTIVLADEIEGVVANDTCNIAINNWKTVGTITSDDTDGYKEFVIATAGKFLQLKVILKGSDVTVEELQVLNKTQLKSV